MPPKKRTSSKKTSKKGSGDDSAKDMAQWARNGRVDAKGLSKSLPGVAEAIRAGRIQPSEVPKMVEEANKDDILAQLHEALPESLRGVKIQRMGGLEIMTGAEPLLCDLVRATCGMDENLSHAFAHDFFGPHLQEWGNVRETIQMEGESVTNVTNFTLLFQVQHAYDRACEKWKSQIESLTKKPLQEHCTAYNVSPVEFLGRLAELILRDENFSLEHLCRDMAFTKAIEIDQKVSAAAQGVKNGWDVIRHKCWECGKQDGKMSKCTACMAARYCSVECQRKSWKSGHKAGCAELKIMYQGFKKNLLCIDQAVKLVKDKDETPMYKGCSLAPAGSKDYMLLPMLLTHLAFPVVLNVDVVSNGGATIEHMYKSLADIVRGQPHWLFEDTFHGILPGNLGTISEKATAFELDYVQHALLFLAVDISKVPAWAVYLFRAQLRKVGIDSPSGFMSVNRFLSIYYRFGQAEKMGFENPSARLKSLAKCMTIMIKYFHKKNGPVDPLSLSQSLCEEIAEFRAIRLPDGFLSR